MMKIPALSMLAVLVLAVSGCTSGEMAGSCVGQTRTHYIAADEVDWDYAPSATNAITGQPFGDTEKTFVAPGPERVGSTYTKAVYHEYTDATFSTLATRPPAWQHLGFLGPVLHAEIGDTLSIVFHNNASFSASMHPHGVQYTKANEGASYADGAPSPGDAVVPGGTYTYTWRVTERAGPTPHQGSSTVWMYHSHVDEVADTYAGLIGAIVVTKCGEAKPDGSPKDVDREFVTLFSVMDENQSPLLDKTLDARGLSNVSRDDEFGESNLMHGINGYVYGNLPGLYMKVGDRVRWYVIDLGTEVDLHTPHWHGNVLDEAGMRTDMTELLPGSMKVLDMVPDEPGTWLFHCHVNDHILAGMQARYTVAP